MKLRAVSPLGVQTLPPAPHVESAPGVAGAANAASVPPSQALIGAAAARPNASPAELLLDVVERLDGSAIHRLVAKADKARPKKAPWAKSLAKMEIGEVRPVSVMALRPGQTQLSFDHAAYKMVGFVEDLLKKAPDDVGALFDPDDFPVVVGPDGRFALLRDGHHKLSGLMALSALVHDLAGTTKASSRTALHVGKEWKKLAELIPPPDELKVAVFIEGQEAKLEPEAELTDREATFYALFDDPHLYATPLYLDTRDGAAATQPPDRMSALADNPFRRLAAELVAKFKWKDDGSIKLKAAEAPLWLKGPDAPDYVEFHVADVLEAACQDLGLEYRVGMPLDSQTEAAFRSALREAQRTDHPVLQKIIAFEREVSWDDLRTSMKLVPHAVMDFGAKRPPELTDDEVPVVLLPSEAPDVHRLHAAVRLHEALVAAGADLEAEAITPAIARDAIARLSDLHDEVGLWLNVDGATAGELRRDAELAAIPGLALEQKKAKLQAPDDAPLKPIWLDLARRPESTPFMLGALWSDLLARIDHDPERFEEIADEARARLVSAKTTPEHPFYELVAQLPVVVSGRPDAIAASLRVGRKKGRLKFGQPVNEGLRQPDLLGPRSHLLIG